MQFKMDLRHNNRDDLTGKRSGRLVAIKLLDEKSFENNVWLCRCDCGNYCKVSTAHWGTTKSCGCLRTEILTADLVEDTRLRNLTAKRPQRSGKDSGVKGVVWDKENNKWRAQIGLQGKHIHLGRYSDLEEAIRVRKEAEEKYFKPILDKYKKGDEKHD
jgi:hypothetical protein